MNSVLLEEKFFNKAEGQGKNISIECDTINNRTNLIQENNYNRVMCLTIGSNASVIQHSIHSIGQHSLKSLKGFSKGNHSYVL